jgi:predicted alpha-1,6-mannanase (GH76 family)
MINGDGLINDGLNAQGENNGQATWTYNQGVILGGLVALVKGDRRRDVTRASESDRKRDLAASVHRRRAARTR